MKKRCFDIPSRDSGLGVGSRANDPGDGTLAAASSDVATLAAQSEKLRDLVDEIRTQMNDLLGKLRTHGLIAS